MDLDTLVGQLLNNPASLRSIIAPLPDGELDAVVDRLKQEADRHWWINANRSLEIADIIIQIGQLRGNLCRSALATAESLGETGRKWIGPLYTNMGFAYEALGDLHQALVFHERARAIQEGSSETRMIAIAETNIAIIAMKQGHYRRALNLL